LGELLREVIPSHEQYPYEIVTRLFQEPARIISQEQAKLASVEQAHKVTLEFRVVHSIPFGLWGMNIGTCIATDLPLWNNPNFFLLAIIDKKTKKTVGFVHLFQKKINDEWVLTTPGINPSIELISEVKVEALYPLIEDALLRIQEAGNYAHIYIPTMRNKGNITSDLAEVVKVIRGRYGSPITLQPPVKWSTYPFAEVWEIKKPQSTPAVSIPVQPPNQPEETTGGINLREKNLNLEIKTQRAGPAAQTQSTNESNAAFLTDPSTIEGLIPVINSIGPAGSWENI